MGKELKCPICKKPTSWQDNPFRPFCGERCKLVDLGKWADGSYAVAAEPAPSVLPEEGQGEEYLN